jgi:hypothetical protein
MSTRVVEQTLRYGYSPAVLHDLRHNCWLQGAFPVILGHEGGGIVRILFFPSLRKDSHRSLLSAI